MRLEGAMNVNCGFASASLEKILRHSGFELLQLFQKM